MVIVWIENQRQMLNCEATYKSELKWTHWCVDFYFDPMDCNHIHMSMGFSTSVRWTYLYFDVGARSERYPHSAEQRRIDTPKSVKKISLLFSFAFLCLSVCISLYSCYPDKWPSFRLPTVQFSLVVSTDWGRMNSRHARHSVHHHLLEFTERLDRIDDAIQPSRRRLLCRTSSRRVFSSGAFAWRWPVGFGTQHLIHLKAQSPSGRAGSCRDSQSSTPQFRKINSIAPQSISHPRQQPQEKTQQQL